MKMKKKSFLLCSITIVVTLALSIPIFSSINASSDLSAFSTRSVSYSMILDSSNRATNINNNTFQVRTASNYSLTFGYSGELSQSQNGWEQLTDGSIFNTYASEVNGMTSLTATFSGDDLSICYGYYNGTNIEYSAVHILESGVPYTFDNNNPSYFKFSTSGTVDFTNITIDYTCVKNSEYGQSYAQYFTNENNVRKYKALSPGSLPCYGKANILVFYIDFLNDSNLYVDATEDELYDFFFSEQGKTNYKLGLTPQDSLRSFYYRSSYGKLDIIGDIFSYTFDGTSQNYSDIEIIDTVMDHFSSAVDWSKYDMNDDGYFDGIYLVMKHCYFIPVDSVLYSSEYEKNGLKYNRHALIGKTTINDVAHETCHMFGIGDYYAGQQKNMQGMRMGTIMDTDAEGRGHYGDLPSPYKYILGWLSDAIIINDNYGSFDVTSYSYYGRSIIIIPEKDPTANWFFIDYHTNEGSDYGGIINVDICEQTDEKWNNGLRVTRVLMNTDADLNFQNDEPFSFIEALHPNSSSDNYLLSAGEEITPYTMPSTAISSTKETEGRFGFLTNYSYSGLSISFNSVKNRTAKVTVSYEETPSNEQMNCDISFSQGTINDIYSDTKIRIARIAAPTSLKILGKAFLVDSNNNEYELDLVMDQLNSSFIDVCLGVDDYRDLNKNEHYSLDLSNIKSYYGTNLTFNQAIDNITLPNAVLPLSQSGDDLICNMHGVTNTNFVDLYDVCNNKVYALYFDSSNEMKYKLCSAEYNYLTGEISEQTELEIPEDLSVNQPDEMISKKYGNYYYVFMPIDRRSGEWEKYVIAKYMDNQLVNYLVLESKVFVKINDTGIYYHESVGYTQYYKYVFGTDEVIHKEDEVLTDLKIEVWNNDSLHVSRGDYFLWSHTLDESGLYIGGYQLFVCENQYVFVFATTEYVKALVINQSGDLVDEKVILSQNSLFQQYWPYNLKVYYNDTRIVISLDCKLIDGEYYLKPLLVILDSNLDVLSFATGIEAGLLGGFSVALTDNKLVLFFTSIDNLGENVVIRVLDI